MKKTDEFKNKDFVFYQSASGSNFNCFGEVIAYRNEQEVIIRPILMYNGSNSITNITDEHGLLVAPVYSLSLGTSTLKNKIKILRKQLKNLESLQHDILSKN